MKKYLNISFLLIVTYLTFSCTKKNDNNTVASGQLYFHFHTNIDTSEVDSYNSILRSASGRKVSLSLAQMYISNIELVKLDGSIYPVANKVLLKVFENEAYLIGNLPSGNYKAVHFSVGLSTSDNAKDPVSTDTIFYRPEMWFSTAAQPKGYVYLNVQGKIDTSAKPSGSNAQMVSFVYKIGTIENLKQVVMPDKNFTILPNQTNYVHLIINYMKVFDGIDLSNAANLSTINWVDNANPVAKQIVTNVSGMFSYE